MNKESLRLFTSINKEFYEEYDIDFFSNKSAVLGGIIADAKHTKDHLRKGYKIGKISTRDIKITQKWLIGYAKREMVINSYHAIESFFRLLFAHIEEPACPWIGVAELQNFREFKQRIKKLNSRKYFNSDHNSEITTLLLGSREIYTDLNDDQWQKSIANVVNLVDILCADILNNQDYNAYKHGAALIDTKFGFKLGDGKLIGANKKDTFIYLTSQTEKMKGKRITQINRVYKFMRWEQRFATTYLAGVLLHNLFSLHRVQLGITDPKGNKVFPFHELDPNIILNGDKKNRIMPTTFAESLFERHYEIPPK